MPRRKRVATGGYVFHVLNRAAAQRRIFESDGDYGAFLKVLEQALARTPMRLLSYCVMPNHWHMALWPVGDDDLSNFMRWLTVTHTQRWHANHDTGGTGPLYQGRSKSFSVEQDGHFLTVCRYVERNALRANLVSRAEAWRWSSLWQFANERTDVPLTAWPVPRSSDWVDLVNQPMTESELAGVRASINRSRPFGHTEWTMRTIRKFGLNSSVRSRGRPRGGL